MVLFPSTLHGLMFTVTSLLEYLAIFTLTLSLFRFRAADYRWQIAFSCLSLLMVSYMTRAGLLAEFSPFVQVLVLIVLLWFVFRIQFFYASVMSVLGFVLYGTLQLFIIFAARLVYRWANDIPALPDSSMFIVAMLTSTICLGLGVSLYRRGWGYTFVPQRTDGFINYRKRENFHLLLVVLIALLAIVGAYYLSHQHFHYWMAMTIIMVLLSCVSLLFMRASNLKDRSENIW
ncbi:hypothetical protein [Paenibacillus sp. SYP-B4298]|uniref:hypothetical protein n=1 Tax=Paenibacillus sp. SYP-B4298 TaxID=2996034 RepID=UPI0022DD8F78|nr:hypothetical protein [Paenibacillus sp. SYP-B4298]